MEVKNKYGKSQVVVLNVGQDDLDGMLINWDLTDNGRYDYMEKEFVDSVMGYLPEYAMGYDAGNISITNMVEQVRETAKSVIQIKRINEIKQYLETETPYGEGSDGEFPDNANCFDLMPWKAYSPFDTCASAQMIIKKVIDSDN